MFDWCELLFFFWEDWLQNQGNLTDECGISREVQNWLADFEYWILDFSYFFPKFGLYKTMLILGSEDARMDVHCWVWLGSWSFVLWRSGYKQKTTLLLRFDKDMEKWRTQIAKKNNNAMGLDLLMFSRYHLFVYCNRCRNMLNILFNVWYSMYIGI